MRGAADLLGRNYSVAGEVDGDELIVDQLRALPKPGIAYEGQLHQDEAIIDGIVTVEQTPGRIGLDPLVPHHVGPAHLDFTRRAD